MSLIKKIGTLFMAGAMVLGLGATGARAEQTQPDGSITVSSPVVGASYTAYQVFELTMSNATGEDASYSYTIDTNSPFFDAVVAYANAADETDADGLTLTEITTEAADTDDDGEVDYRKYNVSVKDNFNAQQFGQALQVALSGVEAVEADPEADPPVEAVEGVAPIDASAVAHTPNYEEGKDIVTVATSDQIVFDDAGDGLPLGYYLITAVYPNATYGTVTMTVPGSDPAVKFEFTAEDVDEDGELTDGALAKINDYVAAVVTDDYVEQYIQDNDIKNSDGTPLTEEQIDELKADLIEDMTEDAKAKVKNALANQLAGSESDINVREPILVFVDSTTPNAVIYEKNELDKWDVPVNPSGDALPKDLPDYGEPDGGKNIVINEDPVVYADWTEASIGDSIHYQLRVNAMNFVREGASDTDVKQVKEYFLADYQNAHMTFEEAKGLHVTIFDDNGNNVTSQYAGVSDYYNNDDPANPYLDYTAKFDVFFKNTEDVDLEEAPTDIFGEGTGIMIPWVVITKNEDDLEGHPIYTTSTVIRKDNNGDIIYQRAADGDNTSHMDDDRYLLDKDNNRIPETDTYYIYSINNSDVTIVVDYYMTLDDDAVIDGKGNPNYAQYGYTPVEPSDTTPTDPSEEDTPDQKKEVDKATVYTYALAFVKVDNKAEALENATFQLPFYVKKALAADGSYIYAFDELPETFAEGDSANNYTNILVSPADGVITIKGITQGVYEFTETEAPVGFNILTEPFTVEAKKTGEEVITESTHTIYLDANGNITNEETAVTVTTHTSDGNLPVYEFLPIVNKQGTELPSTGGMGTKLFYAVGGILVAVAGILLVSRKRMLN